MRGQTIKLLTKTFKAYCAKCAMPLHFFTEQTIECAQCMTDLATYIMGGGDNDHAAITAWAWCVL